ncbi:Aldo/keto reductase family protein [compost metagenome]
MLTANSRELAAPAVAAIARRVRASVPQVVFCFARAVGMTPLTGTTSESHMQQDLAAARLELEPGEIDAIDRVAG